MTTTLPLIEQVVKTNGVPTYTFVKGRNGRSSVSRFVRQDEVSSAASNFD